MSAAPAFTARHVQFARAILAAIAALMVTFSPDHSAGVGLAVFSGFALATALVFFLAAWLAARAGGRWPFALLGLIAVVPGMLGGLPALRTTTMFFTLVIAWALVSGLAEFLLGLRARRLGDPAARDALTAGVLTLLLGIVLLLVPWTFSWDYTVEEAGEFTLTGIILGVGAFGAWAWIIAVYLAIAALSPRRTPVLTEAPAEDSTEQRSAV